MKKLTHFSGALPFFIAVFLNAFVDLGHKIIIQNTIFKLYEEQTQILLTAVLNSMILLPFLLLFYPAGRASDTYAKVRVMRTTAWLAVGLCIGICIAYYAGWFWFAFGLTFLLAVQSAFYSPAKLGYIKELFGKERLGEANGTVSALAIIAILAGTLVFSIGFETLYDDTLQSEAQILQNIAPIGWLLLATAIVELFMVYRLSYEASHAAVVSQASPVRTKNILADTLEPIRDNSAIRKAVIGLATFWAIGQVMLAAFPAFLKSETGIENTIALQTILACAGIGIAIGSRIASKLSRTHIELGALPFGALGIAVGLLILPITTNPIISACVFLCIGIAGGIFIVPLNALVQFQAKEGELGKTLAANNWVQNLAMFSFLVLTSLFAYLSLSSKTLLQLIAVIAIIGCLYTIYQLPQSFVRILLSIIARGGYNVNVQGMKNIPANGGLLLLGNHVSWIDWAMIQLASPRPVRFVMIRNIYEKWYLKWFFDLFGCVPIDQGAGSKKAIEKIAELLNNGDVVCLFPEGTISRTGHLVTFRKGYERLHELIKDDIPIIPFYLHGLWGSQWSRANPEYKSRSKPLSTRDIIVAFGKPIINTTPADKLKRHIFELSVSSWENYCDDLPSLSEQWFSSARHTGWSNILSDNTGAQLSGYTALTSSIALAKKIHPLCHDQNIATVLPASIGSALCNMAILQSGKTLVNLNFTSGQSAVQSAIKQANIKTVFSSRKLEKKLHTKGIELQQLCENTNIIYLEDIQKDITLWNKLYAFSLATWLPAWLAKSLCLPKVNTDSTACILFSSGSEGTPKGICLSHKNISTNVKQVASLLNPKPNDVILGNLPPFHAFGLTATQMLPLIEGIPVVCHADPTDALNCAKIMARNSVTILFGTSTFLRFYIKNKRVSPLMLSSLRLVVSGAEKLQKEIKQQFEEKFKKEIFEGYGATETAPVISVNMPDKLGLQDFKVQLGNKPGSVGMPLPGTSVHIIDPDTKKELDTGEAGMIVIGGGQVMQGYLNNPEKTNDVIVKINNTRSYITGDKGYIDEDGFLFIVDRYSRMAKIGGEMVSLSTVEEAISSILIDNGTNDVELVVTAVPDPKKGERLVLLSTTDIQALITADTMSQKGLSTLAIPSTYHIIENIPKLASGKVNFAEVKSYVCKIQENN